MAANTNLENSLICDKNKIDAISKSVNECLSSVIEKNIYWTDEQKSKIRNRLKEAFSQTLKDKLATQPNTLKSQPLNSQVREKRRYIKDELLPEMDEHMVAATKRRRCLPYQIARHQAMTAKCQHTRMGKTKVEVEPELDDALTAVAETPICTKEHVQETSTRLTQVAKEVESLTTQSQDICHVEEIQTSHAQTDTDRALLETRHETLQAALMK